MLNTKYLFKERVEKGFPKEQMLAATQTKGVVPKTHYESRTVIAQKDLHLLKLVLPGDFVISLRSFQGGIEKAYYQGIISPAYTILTHSEKIFGDYFKHLAKSKPFIKLLTTCVTGIREGQNIDYEVLRRTKLPLPPIEEQRHIANYLDWKTSQIAKFIKAKKRMIELLKEQKQVIINDAVTGKIDVRTGKPYPNYRDSGMEWLGRIPEEWVLRKLRTVLFQKTIKNRPSSPLLSVVREKGVIVRNIEDFEGNHNFIPDDLTTYKYVRIGQFAMNKMKAWQGSYGVSKYEGIVSPAYFVFDIIFENLDFFNYAIRSKFYVGYFGKSSDGIRTGQWDLSLQKMKEIPFFVPPSQIQEEIVKFIPMAFEKIETSIAKIESEIELIQEYRTRLIADIVTGKVDVRNNIVPEFKEEMVFEEIEDTFDREEIPDDYTVDNES
jgi:type I restriction enzyme S subunit